MRLPDGHDHTLNTSDKENVTVIGTDGAGVKAKNGASVSWAERVASKNADGPADAMSETHCFR